MPTLYKYKIGEDFFCGWNCYGAELTDREEAKHKKEEAALARERRQHAERSRKRYYSQRDSMKALGEINKEASRRRAVLKIRVSTGEVVGRFASLHEAALAEGISDGAMSRRCNGYSVRVKEFAWKYEAD